MMIIEFIIIFGVLLFVHEFGHFLFAKLFKINVEEFGFGFPPRLLKIGKFRETEISLNWIPFGAFVRLSGENDPNVKGGFSNSSLLARFMTLVGGPLFNLLLGVILFASIFAQVGIPDTKSVAIHGVSEGSPAESAGLLPGEIILAVNDTIIHSTEELIKQIELNLGKEITLKVKKPDGSIELLNATPRVDPPPGEGYLGVTLINPYRDASVLKPFHTRFGQREIMLFNFSPCQVG